jgi:hypothetical protein
MVQRVRVAEVIVIAVTAAVVALTFAVYVVGARAWIRKTYPGAKP